MPSVLWHCWLGGRKGIRSVKNWVVGCWRGYLSGVMCRFAYGPADATATHFLLLRLNPDWFYLSGTGLPGWSQIRGRWTGACYAISDWPTVDHVWHFAATLLSLLQQLCTVDNGIFNMAGVNIFFVSELNNDYFTKYFKTVSWVAKSYTAVCFSSWAWRFFEHKYFTR